MSLQMPGGKYSSGVVTEEKKLALKVSCRLALADLLLLSVPSPQPLLSYQKSCDPAPTKLVFWAQTDSSAIPVLGTPLTILLTQIKCSALPYVLQCCNFSQGTCHMGVGVSDSYRGLPSGSRHVRFGLWGTAPNSERLQQAQWMHV